MLRSIRFDDKLVEKINRRKAPGESFNRYVTSRLVEAVKSEGRDFEREKKHDLGRIFDIVGDIESRLSIFENRASCSIELLAESCAVQLRGIDKINSWIDSVEPVSESGDHE